MSEVFISYKREERKKARAIAEALAMRGYDVWWDIELLPGDRFPDEIKAVIQRSKVAIVLWSDEAVVSDFVRAEASMALNLGILVPVRLDDCELPLPFDEYQTLDLRSWHESLEDPILDPLISAVEKKIGRKSSTVESKEALKDIMIRPEVEVDYWKSIIDREPQDVEEYKAYIAKFGEDGVFSDLALIRIKRLKLRKRKIFTILIATVLGTMIAGATLYVSLKQKEIEAIKEKAKIEAQEILKEANKTEEKIISERKIVPKQSKKEKLEIKRQPIEGWFYVGKFEKNAWKSKTIKNYGNSRPKKGDIVELSKDVNFRSNKPGWPLYRMPPVLIPNQIPAGTQLKIDLILYYVGIEDYTWAKVRYTPK